MSNWTLNIGNDNQSNTKIRLHYKKVTKALYTLYWHLNPWSYSKPIITNFHNTSIWILNTRNINRNSIVFGLYAWKTL